MKHFGLAAAALAAILVAGIAIAAPAGFQQDYDKAVASFRASKSPDDYRRAESQFAALIERKEAGDLLGNCLFWQAECWYGLKEYAKALNAFEKALLLPRSNKEEACRYKVAVCYARLEMNESAKWELTRFLRDYPKSELAGAAKRELDKLP